MVACQTCLMPLVCPQQSDVGLKGSNPGCCFFGDSFCCLSDILAVFLYFVCLQAPTASLVSHLSRELRGECNGLRGAPSLPPALARSSLPKLSAQPLQLKAAMGDGLQAGSSQNPPSAPPPIPFNPPPPETWNLTRAKRQTNQLQVFTPSASVCTSVFF